MTICNLDVRTPGNILQKGMWLGVDLMMLCYAIISSKSCWRQQTQLPPIPQSFAWEYLTSWYNKHKFKQNKQTLVFTSDGRRHQFKAARESERKSRHASALKAIEAATTLKQIEAKKALPQTATVNGDLMFQIISWVTAMRGRGHRMMILAAPFEADAQLVQVSVVRGRGE